MGAESLRIAFFSTHRFDRQFFDAANQSNSHTIDYLESRLTSSTASLAAGATAVCAFVSDTLDEPTLRKLASAGTWMIALRSAGFNNVDLPAARSLGLTVARVPAYSPHSVRL
jgi:D-lactate dehydrogenase